MKYLYIPHLAAIIYYMHDITTLYMTMVLTQGIPPDIGVTVTITRV